MSGTLTQFKDVQHIPNSLFAFAHPQTFRRSQAFSQAPKKNTPPLEVSPVLHLNKENFKLKFKLRRGNHTFEEELLCQAWSGQTPKFTLNLECDVDDYSSLLSEDAMMILDEGSIRTQNGVNRLVYILDEGTLHVTTLHEDEAFLKQVKERVNRNPEGVIRRFTAQYAQAVYLAQLQEIEEHRHSA